LEIKSIYFIHFVTPIFANIVLQIESQAAFQSKYILGFSRLQVHHSKETTSEYNTQCHVSAM